MTLITGGFDRPYAFGVAMALAARRIPAAVIGGGEIDSPEMHQTPGLRFLDFYGDPRQTTTSWDRVKRVASFYLRILKYTAQTDSRIFHLLWNYKIPWFDRTLLMLYYKAFGKSVVMTAHNVNAGVRDGKDSFLNRLTLRIQYQLCDQIFVHTAKMKKELLDDFGVAESSVSVIPFGVNNSVPDTGMLPAEGRRLTGVPEGAKAVLFYGAIRPYKGLEYLVRAFYKVVERFPECKLIIAGEPKRGEEEYMGQIRDEIAPGVAKGQILARLEFIPDSETEAYFKAADVSVLPYTLVFQSGVLFLGYGFGLPAIASDVGSFAEDIAEGETGFVFKPLDSNDLARTIERFFESDLYRELEQRRDEIRSRAEAQHSWDEVGAITDRVYLHSLGILS